MDSFMKSIKSIKTGYTQDNTECGVSKLFFIYKLRRKKI